MEINPKIRYHGRIRPCRHWVCWISQPLRRPVPMARIFATVITTSYTPPIFIIMAILSTPYMAPVCWVKNFSTSAAMVLTTKISPNGPIRCPNTHSFVDTVWVVVRLSIKGLSNNPPLRSGLCIVFVFIHSTSKYIVTGSTPAEFMVTAAFPGLLPAFSTASARPR